MDSAKLFRFAERVFAYDGVLSKRYRQEHSEQPAVTGTVSDVDSMWDQFRKQAYPSAGEIRHVPLDKLMDS